MPTIMHIGPYRLYFYANDRGEPPHVHVERDDCLAKFWLAPVRLASSGRFSRVEIGRIQALVQERREILMEEWHGYFGN
jgi:hypothetical protein